MWYDFKVNFLICVPWLFHRNLASSLEVPDPAEIVPISFEKDWIVEPRNVNAEPFPNTRPPHQAALCILPDSCNI